MIWAEFPPGSGAGGPEVGFLRPLETFSRPLSGMFSLSWTRDHQMIGRAHIIRRGVIAAGDQADGGRRRHRGEPREHRQQFQPVEARVRPPLQDPVPRRATMGAQPPRSPWWPSEAAVKMSWCAGSVPISPPCRTGSYHPTQRRGRALGMVSPNGARSPRRSAPDAPAKRPMTSRSCHAAVAAAARACWRPARRRGRRGGPGRGWRGRACARGTL